MFVLAGHSLQKVVVGRQGSKLEVRRKGLSFKQNKEKGLRGRDCTGGNNFTFFLTRVGGSGGESRQTEVGSGGEVVAVKGVKSGVGCGGSA
jgi:hypothetical protein